MIGYAVTTINHANTQKKGEEQKENPKSFLFPTPPKEGVNTSATPLAIKWISPSKRQERLNSSLLPTLPKKGVNTSALPLAIKWISPAERQEMLSKGLCFNCDNKWVRGHKCLGKFLLLMADKEDDEEQTIDTKQEDAVENRDISILNSLVGHGRPRLLQLWGLLGSGIARNSRVTHRCGFVCASHKATGYSVRNPMVAKVRQGDYNYSQQTMDFMLAGCGVYEHYKVAYDEEEQDSKTEATTSMHLEIVQLLNNHRKKTSIDTGTSLISESDGTLNDATPRVDVAKEVVSPSVIDDTIEKEKLSPFLMDGLDSMLENGPWFIHNNLPIMRKWHLDENLLKEDLICACNNGGRTSYARAMIKLRANVELKDNIVVVMPKITRNDYYTCNIRVEYEWKPSRYACCKVFRHVLKECPKNIDAGAIKNLKKTSQTPKEILVRQKMNPLVPTGIVDSDSKVGLVLDETANLRLSTSGKHGSDKCYGTNSLLEKWTNSYPNNNDYGSYDDDMYEHHDMSDHLQSICDDRYHSLLNFEEMFVVKADALAVGIGVESKLNKLLLFKFHDTPMAEHNGVKKMLVGLSTMIYYKGMRIRWRVWEDASMDFIIGLPNYKGLTVVLVIPVSNIKMTPFQAVYGRVPPSIIPYPPGSSKVAVVEELLVKRDALLRKLKQNLLVATQRMKIQANRKRCDVEFELGYKVPVKLQLYQQVTLVKHHSNKLAKHYYGHLRY
uniref:Zinc knuckle CX2CX4HX4C n=1 Tax=Tanacetum cinerariifolium TaxID=118510 RepID=A0A6L2M0S2_TANCI|nr:zinc knuckle CX2CX4HX4C [Tanacetum cinerariifolium]GEX00721.1 zinc knuckle CX2CX4HX4C [Tanacetum cinerariifolium]